MSYRPGVQVCFLQVAIARQWRPPPAATAAGRSGPWSSGTAGRIEIELPGGLRVRVKGVVDEERQKRVLRVLRQ
jgi:hypothetical protein